MARRDNVSLKTLMRDLHVTRVAFCAEGSNGESDILLYKAKPADELAKVDSYVQTRARLEAALTDQFSSCWVRDFSDSMVVFEQYSNGAERTFQIAWKEAGEDVELVGDRTEVIVTTSFVPVTKGDPTMPDTELTPEQAAALQTAIAAEAAKSAEWLTACYAAQYLAEVDEFQKSLEPDADPLEKADPAVRAAMAKITAENDRLAKQVADLADERALAKHTATAKTMPHVGNTDDVAGVLKTIAEKAPELLEKVEHLFTQAESRLAASGLFKELGGAGETVDEDDIAKLIEGAETPEDLEKAMNDHPEAYAAYVAKTRKSTTA